MNKKYADILLIVVVASLTLAIGFLVQPIPQDPHYHLFADQRRLCGVNHFWNVISNLPFLLAGLYGLWLIRKIQLPHAKLAYGTFCLGVILVCFGSGYYHLNPSNHSLVWDRLPMTIAFMALFSLILHERVLVNPKTYTLIPLLILGAASVFYWDWTESQGQGDLRFYVLVQFLPIFLIPLILWLYPRGYLKSGYLLWAFGFYFLAKLLEHYDQIIFQTLDEISGHSLKHLAAAIAVVFIINAVACGSVKNANH
jgi:hypothetical protein